MRISYEPKIYLDQHEHAIMHSFAKEWEQDLLNHLEPQDSALNCLPTFHHVTAIRNYMIKSSHWNLDQLWDCWEYVRQRKEIKEQVMHADELKKMFQPIQELLALILITVDRETAYEEDELIQLSETMVISNLN